MTETHKSWNLSWQQRSPSGSKSKLWCRLMFHDHFFYFHPGQMPQPSDPEWWPSHSSESSTILAQEYTSCHLPIEKRWRYHRMLSINWWLVPSPISGRFWTCCRLGGYRATVWLLMRARTCTFDIALLLGFVFTLRLGRRVMRNPLSWLRLTSSTRWWAHICSLRRLGRPLGTRWNFTFTTIHSCLCLSRFVVNLL